MITNLSTLQNLYNFIENHAQDLKEGRDTLCIKQGKSIKQYLPCGKKTNGVVAIDCNDCPFNSAQAAEETLVELTQLIKHETLLDIIQGNIE